MLPKIKVSTNSKTLPISKLAITYRPFQVKEEKIMLIAQESGDEQEMLHGFRQIINNCIIEDVDIGKQPLFDLEYTYILLRIASVSDVAEFKVYNPEDGKQYDVILNLREALEEAVKDLKVPERKIVLDEAQGIGVIMNDLTYDLFTASTGGSETESALKMLYRMIGKIYDEDNVYDTKDHSEEELAQWVEEMPSGALAKLQEYVDNLPRLRLVATYKTPTGPKKFVLEGLRDFFQYA